MNTTQHNLLLDIAISVPMGVILTLSLIRYQKENNKPLWPKWVYVGVAWVACQVVLLGVWELTRRGMNPVVAIVNAVSDLLSP